MRSNMKPSLHISKGKVHISTRTSFIAKSAKRNYTTALGRKNKTGDNGRQNMMSGTVNRTRLPLPKLPEIYEVLINKNGVTKRVFVPIKNIPPYRGRRCPETAPSSANRKETSNPFANGHGILASFLAMNNPIGPSINTESDIIDLCQEKTDIPSPLFYVGYLQKQDIRDDLIVTSHMIRVSEAESGHEVLSHHTVPELKLKDLQLDPSMELPRTSEWYQQCKTQVLKPIMEKLSPAERKLFLKRLIKHIMKNNEKVVCQNTPAKDNAEDANFTKLNTQPTPKSASGFDINLRPTCEQNSLINMEEAPNVGVNTENSSSDSYLPNLQCLIDTQSDNVLQSCSTSDERPAQRGLTVAGGNIPHFDAIMDCTEDLSQSLACAEMESGDFWQHGAQHSLFPENIHTNGSFASGTNTTTYSETDFPPNERDLHIRNLKMKIKKHLQIANIITDYKWSKGKDHLDLS